MVKKEFSTPIASDTTVENGIEATNYNDVSTEIKEVESDFKKGIVLKVPYDYEMLTKSDSKFPTKPNIDIPALSEASLLYIYFTLFLIKVPFLS